ncbi:MAG: endonuclease, partial [Nanoarchaeota archaeon]|nr:endonuclease [Nanoarchaeota archaeon]
MVVEIYRSLFEKFGKQHWWPVSSENEQFEVIIGAILTQNTSWKNVEKAIENLKQSGLIDVEKMGKVKTSRLAQLIRPSGYFNQKAERLKIMARFLSENDISLLGVEEMREKLLCIKGVGPETADSIILYAYNKPSFVVDMYTRRLFSRLGLVDKTASYDEVKQFFETKLKKDT